ncbi:polysaccharide pyruvyl transferase family protein [Virgibacillus sp. 179-BFC.A HS]|uniref:Polysaccharide pyruvyl transferase family protein n=1 Tax=Tigheibacillus jepli TaxID=3035914 RepID=A0ABU5CFU5_9BACI|nr:polysaccharide pyruvyl transferase family protein [Virgibacillus sp. 179-BFC.A HS]MDY0404729.1 polysaccharide pyruvyl transferase family protein [Virgibacillus sp. 179-BFC.A HS]
MLHLAKKCDAVVQIGGSLFMETKHWHAEWQKTADIRKASMAFFLLGSNFGPFQQKLFYQKYKQLFATYTDICFRETYSYHLFATLENVRAAPDIVFSLPVPEQSAGQAQPINARPKLVISVIKPSIRPHLAAFDDIYYEKMREIAIYFIHAGFAVTFAAFCSYEGDELAMQSITSGIPETYMSDISTYVHQSNPAETIRLLNQASIIIASRFHAMIVGWVLEKPVFPIIYSKKMTNVMDDIGFTGSSVDFEQLQALEPTTILKQMTDGAPDIGKQRQQAQNHFAMLDAFLQEE